MSTHSINPTYQPTEEMEEEKARMTALHTDHITSLLAKALEEKEQALAGLAHTHAAALEAIHAAHYTEQQQLTEELESKTLEQLAMSEQRCQVVADQRVEDLRIELKNEMVTDLSRPILARTNFTPNLTLLIVLLVNLPYHNGPLLLCLTFSSNLPLSRPSNWL